MSGRVAIMAVVFFNWAWDTSCQIKDTVTQNTGMTWLEIILHTLQMSWVMELRSGISGVLGSSNPILRRGVPKLNSWVRPSSSRPQTLLSPSCSPPFFTTFVLFWKRSAGKMADYVIYITVLRCGGVFDPLTIRSLLKLCKEFARADSRCGMTGICWSSTPAMDIDPLRGGSDGAGTWLPSLACALMGPSFQDACTWEHV